MSSCHAAAFLADHWWICLLQERGGEGAREKGLGQAAGTTCRPKRNPLHRDNLAFAPSSRLAAPSIAQATFFRLPFFLPSHHITLHRRWLNDQVHIGTNDVHHANMDHFTRPADCPGGGGQMAPVSCFAAQAIKIPLWHPHSGRLQASR